MNLKSSLPNLLKKNLKVWLPQIPIEFDNDKNGNFVFEADCIWLAL